MIMKRVVFVIRKVVMDRKYILFDLDGTLTDPMQGITKSVRYALNSFGIEVDDLCKLIPFIGPPLKDSFNEFYGFNEEDAIVAVEKYREYYRIDGIFDNKVYEGIEECLKALKKEDKILVLATSKPEVFAKKIMDHFNLSKYFDFIGGSELNGRSKKGEVIEYVLKSMQINPGDAIMVGDRMHDIIGAHEHNLPCIAVEYGYGNIQEFKQYHADYIVKTVNELQKLISFK